MILLFLQMTVAFHYFIFLMYVFYSVDRASLFDDIRACIPSLAGWMESWYGSQPYLHVGSDTILSCCGVQQGDPLGHLGFCLTLHPIVECIQAEVPSLLLNVWYLDDGTLCGSLSDLPAALKIIESNSPSRGLHLKRSKSLLFIPEEADASSNPLPAEIPVFRLSFTLLSCPLVRRSL